MCSRKAKNIVTPPTLIPSSSPSRALSSPPPRQRKHKLNMRTGSTDEEEAELATHTTGEDVLLLLLS
jgi:hypothetical protein